jgi:hypothetical protein
MINLSVKMRGMRGVEKLDQDVDAISITQSFRSEKLIYQVSSALPWRNAIVISYRLLLFHLACVLKRSLLQNSLRCLMPPRSNLHNCTFYSPWRAWTIQLYQSHNSALPDNLKQFDDRAGRMQLYTDRSLASVYASWRFSICGAWLAFPNPCAASRSST